MTKSGDLVRILVSTLLHKKNAIGIVLGVDYKLNPVATVALLGGKKIRIATTWLEVISENR